VPNKSITRRSAFHSVGSAGDVYDFIRHFLTFASPRIYDRVNSNIFGSHPGVGAAFYVQDELMPFSITQINCRNQVRLAESMERNICISCCHFPIPVQSKNRIGFLPGPITTLRASYGEGFRYPSISELFTSVPRESARSKSFPTTA